MGKIIYFEVDTIILTCVCLDFIVFIQIKIDKEYAINMNSFVLGTWNKFYSSWNFYFIGNPSSMYAQEHYHCG